MLFWQALLLHDNWLSGIDRPERLHDFRTLRVCLHYIYTLMPSWWNLLLPVLLFPPIVTCIIFPSHCYLYYFSLPLLPVLLFPPIITCIIFPPIVTCIIIPSHCYLYYYSLPLLPVLVYFTIYTYLHQIFAMFSGRLQHLPEFKFKFPTSTTHRLPPLK